MRTKCIAMIGNRLPVRWVSQRLAETWVVRSVCRGSSTRRHDDQGTSSRLASIVNLLAGSVCPASTCLVRNGIGWVVRNRRERGTILAFLTRHEAARSSDLNEIVYPS